MDCRKKSRIELMHHIINDLQGEDKNGYYEDEFWLDTSDQPNGGTGFNTQ